MFDAVYNPPTTALILSAEERGCRVVRGAEMFIRQAAFQFELWTGQRAPLDAMRRAFDLALSGCASAR